MNLETFINIETLGIEQEVLNQGINPLRFKKENGLYVLENRIEKCHSYVENLNICLYNLIQWGTTQALDTGGTLRTLFTGNNTGAASRFSISNFYGSGVTTGGIQVGTGTTATTISTYTIQTLIAHGTSTGQLSYGSTNLPGWSNSGSDSYYEVSRTFTNSSGANITINEVTCVVRMNNTSTNHFLIERTVLGSPETINNGSSKTFTYKFTITV